MNSSPSSQILVELYTKACQVVSLDAKTLNEVVFPILTQRGRKPVRTIDRRVDIPDDRYDAIFTACKMKVLEILSAMVEECPDTLKRHVNVCHVIDFCVTYSSPQAIMAVSSIQPKIHHLLRFFSSIKDFTREWKKIGIIFQQLVLSYGRNIADKSPCAELTTDDGCGKLMLDLGQTICSIIRCYPDVSQLWFPSISSALDEGSFLNSIVEVYEVNFFQWETRLSSTTEGMGDDDDDHRFDRKDYMVHQHEILIHCRWFYLQIVHHWVQLFQQQQSTMMKMMKQELEMDELFTILMMLMNLSNDYASSVIHYPTDGSSGDGKGMILSDLNELFQLYQNIQKWIGHEDEVQFEYLQMIFQHLPRRCVSKNQFYFSTKSHQLKAKRSSPTTFSSSCAKSDIASAALAQQPASLLFNTEGDDDDESYTHEDLTTPISSTDDHHVRQIQDMFPDLETDFVQRCLSYFNQNLEQTIMCLLEDNVPPELKEYVADQKPPAAASIAQRRNSKRQRELQEQLLQLSVERSNVYDGDAFDSSTNVDESRLWVGKKSDGASKYDPSSIQQDQTLKDIQAQVLRSYDYSSTVIVDAHDDAMYDDDHDDEYEDGYFVPYTIHDSHTAVEDDMDSILEYNRMVRAKEEEDQFWEDMKNTNRQQRTAPSTAKDESESQQTNAGTSSHPQQLKKQPKSKQAKQRDSSVASSSSCTSSADEADETKGKTSSTVVNPGPKSFRNKNKHKAKIGNHNRKSQALKKRS